MRQRINIREHFWRGNATLILIVALQGEAIGQAGALGALEVVGAEVVVIHPAPEHDVHRREDRPGHRHNGLLRTPAGLQSQKQRPEVAALRPLGQDRPLTIRTAGVSLTYGRRAPARPAYVVTARTCDKSTTRQRGRPAV